MELEATTVEEGIVNRLKVLKSRKTEAVQRLRSYEIEDFERGFDYEPFIAQFLAEMDEYSLLDDEDY